MITHIDREDIRMLMASQVLTQILLDEYYGTTDEHAEYVADNTQNHSK